jgi:hypothetical protein
MISLHSSGKDNSSQKNGRSGSDRSGNVDGPGNFERSGSNGRKNRGGRGTLDTWEKFQDEAVLWRVLTLIQFPITLVSLILAVFLGYSRSVVVNVPPKPAPGTYAPNEIPEAEFIDNATEFVNLIASYQPLNARRQFDEAAKRISEPFLTYFRDTIVTEELKTVESTNRSQFFFIDPTQTKVAYTEEGVKVTLQGERVKIVAGQELPGLVSRYSVTMRTIPRHKLNPYGIMVTGMGFENLVNK